VISAEGRTSLAIPGDIRDFVKKSSPVLAFCLGAAPVPSRFVLEFDVAQSPA
jgi:hypothetical protein